MKQKTPDSHAIVVQPVKKCAICTDPEVATWIRDCLEKTKSAGLLKPPASLVHREAKDAFPERMPVHENSTRRHLRDHEPAYTGWD